MPEARCYICYIALKEFAGIIGTLKCTNLEEVVKFELDYNKYWFWNIWSFKLGSYIKTRCIVIVTSKHNSHT